MVGTTDFVRVWRFRPAPDAVSQFERVYGSSGEWARLFRLADGFRGTELQRLADGSGEYLTIDRWESRSAWETFRRDHAAAYERLDRECARLTVVEQLVRETDESRT